MFRSDLPGRIGDLRTLCPGDAFEQIDAEDKGDQKGEAADLDDPKSADAVIEQTGEKGGDRLHAAILQAGASVRTPALSLAERARGLAAISASPGPWAPLKSRVKVGRGPPAVGG